MLKKLATILFFVLAFLPITAANLFEQFTKNEGLLSNQTFGVVQDKQGLVWVANLNGVCSFNASNFSCYNLSKNLENDEIIGLILDHTQKVWCYTLSGKLFYFNGAAFVPFKLNQAIQDIIKNRLINTVTFGSSGKIYISTVLGSGYLQVNPTTERIVFETTTGTKAKFFVIEVEPNCFVSGTVSGGTHTAQLWVKTQNFETHISLAGSTEMSKSSILKLQNNTLLFAKDFELIQFDSSGIKSRIFVEKSIECLLQDQEKNVWVGLNQGGLLQFNSANINKHGTLAFLGTRTITSLFQDKQGTLWISTANNGVFSYQTIPNVKLVNAKTLREKQNIDSIQESLKTNKHIEESKTIDSKTNQQDLEPPGIYLTQIQILNRDTTILPFYDLPYYKNFLKIQFAGISKTNPNLVQFKYQLQGINKDWVYSSNNEAQFTTLPPGKYTFKVAAMNKDGIWSKKPAEVVFLIRHPFWQKWWFIAIVSLVVIAVLIFTIRHFILSVRQKEQVKSEINKRIADLELQALRAQMNPHFLFNTISSIQYFITSNNAKSALSYLSKFAKLMRSIMENSKKPRILLQDEINALQLYLELEALRFKGKFTFNIHVDHQIDLMHDEIPPMLIQPYIENAINHGIMNKPTNGHIEVSLIKNSNLLICTVQDDGIGRDAAQKIKEAKVINHKSRGMEITKSRLEIINKIENSELNVEIIDLTDAKNQPAGTLVKIYVPLKN